MMDFPAAPIDGQAYVPNAQTRWTWKAADNAWVGGVGFQIVDDEAPLDGESYARVATGSGLAAGVTGETGIWVPSVDRTILTPVGVSTIDYTIPASARLLRITGHCRLTSGNNYVFITVSYDGTSFLSGAADYRQAGLVAYAGTTTWQSIAYQNAPNHILHVSGDQNNSLPAQFEALFMVERAAGGGRYMGAESAGVSYYSNALYYDAITYLRTTQVASTSPRYAKIRFNAYAGTFLAGSFIEIEELA